MSSRHWFTRLAPGLLALAAVVAPAAPASAGTATYNLVALPSTATMPDSTTIPMWGYFEDTGQLCTATPAWNVGPKLLVNPGDSLTVNLRNCLPQPVSIVIPGQAMPTVSTGSAPVRHPSGPFAGRVRSFTGEAAASGGTCPASCATYTWSPLKPGTNVYHSGTHPQVQVQMGLYGPVTKDFATSEAYQSVSYNKQKDLFFSEIDPALHQAVAGGTYGTPPGPTSTLDYHPKYFLINGKPFSVGDPCMSGLVINDDVLLRLYNTGLNELAPMMLGSHFQVVAEGGNKYQFPWTRYSVLLPPAATKDLLFRPTRNATFPILERRLNLTNAAATNGGMQTCLLVAAAPTNTPPVANSQSVTTNEDTALPITLTATDADNGPNPLTYTVTQPVTGGSVSGGTGPNRTFTPTADFFGATSFTFTAFDGADTSNVATVSITVNPVNDAPSFTAGANQTVTQPAGAQTVPSWATAISAGPTNESGQTVSFLVSNNNNALFLVQPAVSPTGTLTYTPASGSGSATVTVQAQDNGGTANGGVNTSEAQNFTITVNPAPLVAIHIGDLDGSTQTLGGNRWRARVTVTVHNQGEGLVANATVTGTWSAGDTNGRQLSCTTGLSGTCTVQSGRLSRTNNNNPSVIFTVTSVTAAGATYLSAANHDGDTPADSTGTSITVNRP